MLPFCTKCFGGAKRLRISFALSHVQKRREDAHALEKLRETQMNSALFVGQIHCCFSK
jgi:hypothetical protein